MKNIHTSGFLPVYLLFYFMLIIPAAFAQDEGEIMQIYERAEEQSKALKGKLSSAAPQFKKTREAIDAVLKAEAHEDIPGAVEHALAEIHKSEKLYDDLSTGLRELSRSIGGLGQLKESNEGQHQLDTLVKTIDSTRDLLGKLTAAQNPPGLVGHRAEVAEQKLNILEKGLQEMDELSNKQKNFEAQAEKAALAKENYKRVQQVLEASSNFVDIGKLTLGINRELMLAKAIQDAGTKEIRDSLERIIVNIGSPSQLVTSVLDSINETDKTLVDLIDSILSTGMVGLPDFSDEDTRVAYDMLNTIPEEGCFLCTDGVDNDGNGLIDGEEELCGFYLKHETRC